MGLLSKSSKITQKKKTMHEKKKKAYDCLLSVYHIMTNMHNHHVFQHTSVTITGDITRTPFIFIFIFQS